MHIKQTHNNKHTKIWDKLKKEKDLYKIKIKKEKKVGNGVTRLDIVVSKLLPT